MLFSLLKTFLSFCWFFWFVIVVVVGGNVERINRDHYPQHPNQRQALLTFWPSSLNHPTFCIHSCLRSVTKLCPTLCNLMDCRTPGFPVLHYLPEFSQTHVHWVGDAIQPLVLCRPLLLLSSIFPSISVFFNESALHTRWPKYWNFMLGSNLPLF